MNPTTEESTVTEVNDSILTSIKKLLNIAKEYEIFDTDIIIHINSAFARLNELGLGPEKGFRITGSTECWSDFMAGFENLDYIKTFIYLKVKIIFDPPINSAILETYKQEINKYEWLLTTHS